MDVTSLFLIATIVSSVFVVGKELEKKNIPIIFNINEKLRMATTTTTTTEGTKTGQMIRVPDLDCPLGHRRDRLGICRQSF